MATDTGIFLPESTVHSQNNLKASHFEAMVASRKPKLFFKDNIFENPRSARLQTSRSKNLPPRGLINQTTPTVNPTQIIRQRQF